MTTALGPKRSGEKYGQQQGLGEQRWKEIQTDSAQFKTRSNTNISLKELNRN